MRGVGNTMNSVCASVAIQRFTRRYTLVDDNPKQQSSDLDVDDL